MSMKLIVFAVASVLGMGMTAGGASAISLEFNVGPGFYYDYNNRHYDNWGISADDAVRIAKHHGVRYVDKVSRDSDSYEVSGETKHHNDITVTIDRQSGEVTDVERD
jgi:hypothetical protein